MKDMFLLSFAQCAFMTEYSFIFLTHLVLLAFLLSTLLPLRKSIIVKNKNKKNEQQSSEERSKFLKITTKIIH